MAHCKIIKEGDNIKLILTYRPWYWPFSEKIKEYFANGLKKSCYDIDCPAFHRKWMDGETGKLVKCSMDEYLNEQADNLIRKHEYTRPFIKSRFVLNEKSGYRQMAGFEEEYEEK